MSRSHYEGRSRGMSARRAFDSSPERYEEEPEDDDPYVTPLMYSRQLFESQLHKTESPGAYAAHCLPIELVGRLSSCVQSVTMLRIGHTRHVLESETMVCVQLVESRLFMRIYITDAQPGVEWPPKQEGSDNSEPPVYQWNGRRRADPVRPMSVPPSHTFYPPPNLPSGFPPHLHVPFATAFPPMFASHNPHHGPPPPGALYTFRGPGYAPHPTQSVPMYALRRDLPRVGTPPHTDPLRTRGPRHLTPKNILWPVEDWPPAEDRRGLDLILYQLLLTSSGQPIMKWDMKEFPEDLRRWCPRGLHVPITKAELSAPVSHPPLNKMEISIKDSPFAPIIISKSGPLTLRDVLDAIFDHLHVIITPGQYDMMDPFKRERVKRTFYRRCEEGNLGLPEYERRRGVKRIDWFEGKSMFGGLEDARVAPTGEICCNLAVLG